MNDPIPWLACRSTYSLLAGALEPRDLCRKAREAGQSCIGLADLGNFYGLVRFLQAAREHDVKPLLAMDFGTPEADGPLAWVVEREGYGALNGLVSRLLDAPVADRGAMAMAHFAVHGWAGLVLAVPPQLAAHFAAAARTDLFVALRWGRAQLPALQAAKNHGLPLLAVAGGAWTSPPERYRLDLLRAIDRRCTVADLPAHEKHPDAGRIPPGPELEAFFSCSSAAVRNARELAQRCVNDVLPTRFVFPSFMQLEPPGALAVLAQRCRSAIGRRFPGREEAARKRLDHELAIIGDKDFASYFLVVADIVAQSPRTCGRGSGASSIVSYLLGITHVDPLRYNLFFERFLHRARKDPPDIDIDFPHDEREATLRYVFDRYPGQSAMVADHVTFASRSAIREGVLALGETVAEVERYQEAWRLERWDAIPPYVWAAYRTLKGVIRNLGTHPGGVVIVPGHIHQYVHTQTSNLGWPLLAWEKDATEDAGLVKIDLLGNRSLGVLRDVLSAVSPPGRAMEFWNDMGIIDHPLARQDIESGDTLGVFYVESPATRQLLRKMGTGDYEHLVVASSIIRPAANRFIKDYVDRLHGKPWRPIHPRLGDLLGETCGIMVYQEDVSRVAMAVAGFSAEDADALRKVLSKKDRELRLPDFRAQFALGAARLGLGPGQIDQLWDMILSFDGYSFCKSHSASYALVSYQLAYLRHLHPLEFYTAVINNGGGFYDRQVYLNQIRRMGFAVLPPSVRHPHRDYRVEGGAVRVGLGQIKGLGERLLASIEHAAEARQFTGLEDFLHRCRPDRTELSLLVRAGALDAFITTGGRPGLLWRSFSLEGAASAQGNLLDASPPPMVEDYRPSVRLRDEIETLGIWHSVHPLLVFGERARRLAQRLGLPPPCTSAGLQERTGQVVSIAGTVVAGKEVITRQAKTMGFLSFEDPEGLFETVVFPDVWQRILPVLMGGNAFLVTGTASREQGALSINLDNLFLLNRRYMS